MGHFQKGFEGGEVNEGGVVLDVVKIYPGENPDGEIGVVGGDANPIRTLGDYSSPSHEGYRNTIELPEGNNVVPLRSDTIRNAKESWAILEYLALYDNKSWNDPKDFAKPVKAISLPQDVLSTSHRHPIELENQVEHLMEAHLAPKQTIQVNKITSSCEICSSPHDTQYCMENLEQAFVDYASSLPIKDEASGTLSNLSKTILVTPTIRHGKVTQILGLVSNFMASQDARLSKFEADFKQQKSEMTNKIDTVLKAIIDRIIGDDGDMMFIEIIKNTDDSHKEEPEVGQSAKPSFVFIYDYMKLRVDPFNVASYDVSCGDDVAGIKRRRLDISGDGVGNLATASRRGRLKADPESPT
nr:MAK10-like protein [Tanacetum cinerariifolium]